MYSWQRKTTDVSRILKHGVGIQKELDEAETDFKNKKTSLSNASSALKVYNSKGGGIGVRLL
jgi:cobalt-zinc-cadmium efflux system membrane fusion protein